MTTHDQLAQTTKEMLICSKSFRIIDILVESFVYILSKLRSSQIKQKLYPTNIGSLHLDRAIFEAMSDPKQTTLRCSKSRMEIAHDKTKRTNDCFLSPIVFIQLLLLFFFLLIFHTHTLSFSILFVCI